MMPGVLVLAAGKGTRIAPLTGGSPKPLLVFGGKRLIEWTLEWLASYGIRSVRVNLHHRPGEVREALGRGDRFGVRIDYAVEDEILGTAGAWRALAREWRGTTLVVYGDNVVRFDLERFQAVHRGTGALATIALFDPARHANTGIAGGRVVLDGSGRVVEFHEGVAAGREGIGLVNAGAYLLEPELLEAIGEGYRDFGRDVYPGLLASGRVFGHVIEESGFCLGLDTPEHYAAGARLLEAGKVVLT